MSLIRSIWSFIFRRAAQCQCRVVILDVDARIPKDPISPAIRTIAKAISEDKWNKWECTLDRITHVETGVSLWLVCGEWQLKSPIVVITDEESALIKHSLIERAARAVSGSSGEVKPE